MWRQKRRSSSIMDQQNNASSVRSGASIRNGRDGSCTTELEDFTGALLGAYSRGMCSHPNTSDAWRLVTTRVGCEKEIRSTDCTYG